MQFERTRLTFTLWPMAILIHCDGCGKKIRAGEAWAGREATCPGCGNQIAVPSLPRDDPAVRWADTQHVHVSPQEIDEIEARDILNTAATTALEKRRPENPPQPVVITEIRTSFAAAIILVWKFFWATVVVALIVAGCLYAAGFLLFLFSIMLRQVI